MNVVCEAAREVPVACEVDVCVLGGSCTGVFAALAAARLGASVAIVENSGCFGGTATAGMVTVWHMLTDTTGQRQIIAGLTQELIDRLKARGAAVEPERITGMVQFEFNPAEMMIELDAMIREAHIRPFLHARFCRALAEGPAVTAAILEDKSGRRAIRARVYIDATGDGDLVYALGLPTCKAPHLQPPTTTAFISGIDEVARRNPGFHLSKAVFDPKYPQALRQGFLWDRPAVGGADIRMVAGTRVHGADCSDADQLTAAEMEGRRQVRCIVDNLRANFAGGQGVNLLALPSHIGVRQTRQAVCAYRLTEMDVLEGRRFDDAIANGCYRVDIHHAQSGGLTFRYLNGVEEIVCPGQPIQTRRWRAPRDVDPTFYQIPYRCLLAPGATNVLVAGRCIDADQGAYAAVRVMVLCNQTGQAAGVAAALALRQDCPVAHVSVQGLRRALADQGAIVI